jgi:hypothetical protein
MIHPWQLCSVSRVGVSFRTQNVAGPRPSQGDSAHLRYPGHIQGWATGALRTRFQSTSISVIHFWLFTSYLQWTSCELDISKADSWVFLRWGSYFSTFPYRLIACVLQWKHPVCEEDTENLCGWGKDSKVMHCWCKWFKQYIEEILLWESITKNWYSLRYIR